MGPGVVLALFATVLMSVCTTGCTRKETVDDESLTAEEAEGAGEDPEGKIAELPGDNPCPPPRDVDAPCAEMTVFARASDGEGPCCYYPTPCQAPEGWLKYSQERCEGELIGDAAAPDVPAVQGEPPEACPPPRRYEGMCAQMVVYAQHPQGGPCCFYSTPCAAPQDWKQFASEACERDADAGAATPSDDGRPQ